MIATPLPFSIVLLLAAIALPPAVLILDSIIYFPPRGAFGIAGRLGVALALAGFTFSVLGHALWAMPT